MPALALPLMLHIFLQPYCLLVTPLTLPGCFASEPRKFFPPHFPRSQSLAAHARPPFLSGHLSFWLAVVIPSCICLLSRIHVVFSTAMWDQLCFVPVVSPVLGTMSAHSRGNGYLLVEWINLAWDCITHGLVLTQLLLPTELSLSFSQVADIRMTRCYLSWAWKITLCVWIWALRKQSLNDTSETERVNEPPLAQPSAGHLGPWEGETLCF